MDNNKPVKVIQKHFPVKLNKAAMLKAIAAHLPEEVTVEFGINPEKGGLTAYGWTDGDGNKGNLGRFPVTGYSSQWKMRAPIACAALAFIAYDETQDTPRLATKASAGTSKTEMEDGVNFDTEDLDTLLAATAE